MGLFEDRDGNVWAFQLSHADFFAAGRWADWGGTWYAPAVLLWPKNTQKKQEMEMIFANIDARQRAERKDTINEYEAVIL